jgi:hypothetical protein
MPLMLVLTTAVGTAGCVSGPKAPKAPVQKTELLDWKGSALGVQVPQWVVQAQESNVHIQSLAEFKDQYCFVVTRENENQDLATAWVNNAANGASEVARMLSSTVNDHAEAHEGMKTGDERLKQASAQIRTNMSNASFKGLRKASDTWTLSRNVATGRQYYTAYSLWIIPEKDLNEQMAAIFQNIIDNNKALSKEERQIYLDIIKNIRTRGIQITSGS